MRENCLVSPTRTPCGRSLSWPVWPLVKGPPAPRRGVRPHLWEMRTKVGQEGSWRSSWVSLLEGQAGGPRGHKGPFWETSGSLDQWQDWVSA